MTRPNGSTLSQGTKARQGKANIETHVDKIQCFVTSMKVREESGMGISRSKTPFKAVRFEGKHEGDRSNVNIPAQSLHVGSG